MIIMFVSFLKKIGQLLLDFIETVVIALAIFVIVYLFLWQPHQVKGNSMLPNFHNGEYILTDKISYRFGEPKRGDIIVFKAPKNEDYDYIKRIVGLPEDKIQIKGGRIYLNNTLLDENSYLDDTVNTRGGSFLSEGEIKTIAEDSYVAVGDNRAHSSDSREWGAIPRGNIIGKAWLRYWPISKAGLIPKATFAN